MNDLISRQAAIDAYGDWYVEEGTEEGFIGTVKQLLEGLPSAQPESDEYARGYNDAKREIALSGEYERAYQRGKEDAQQWTPCSERLPKAEDMHQPPEQRYLCQLEAHGERKFCVLSRLKGAVSPFWDWYGIAVYDSEVTAWMPLPKPYKGGAE